MDQGQDYGEDEYGSNGKEEDDNKCEDEWTEIEFPRATFAYKLYKDS